MSKPLKVLVPSALTLTLSCDLPPTVVISVWVGPKKLLEPAGQPTVAERVAPGSIMQTLPCGAALAGGMTVRPVRIVERSRSVIRNTQVRLFRCNSRENSPPAAYSRF
jgi:hypothetical protein